MKLFRKPRKRNFFIPLLVLAIIGAGYVFNRLREVTRSQWDDNQMTAVFNSGEYGEATLGYLEGPSRKIRFLQIGEDPDKPMVVFIHGSPSSSSFWANMMKDSALRAEANLLAIDRPGYGGSGLGQAMISVKEQAENVAEIIRRRRPGKDKRLVLHGSSYGGTVSARIAMDYPKEIDGVLLQSASTAPLEEFTYWISYPSNHWSLRWLMPKSIQTVNTEKLNHQPQLEEMADGWKNITAQVVIAHGTADWLIYPPNAYYSCDQLVNAEEVIHHMLAGKKHNLIRTAPDLLKHYIHYLLQEPVQDSIPPAAAVLTD
ncbi:alpha/beta hydrolase [Neolewinella aurantiaca]|uniref:Alpha/beta hydrolase n=1 Tax=Neolewinella aurantiaca TaxID=2602767 RepID=A0A5C7FIZ7_9BACT|nr:alpha/beta hydrolase [Neolewinella aurantiaca]TXF91211.1 alpha/beta hydrolase [Neolewinella aurantiaca]